MESTQYRECVQSASSLRSRRFTLLVHAPITYGRRERPYRGVQIVENFGSELVFPARAGMLDRVTITPWRNNMSGSKSLAEKIREHVIDAFIEPARRAGLQSVSVCAGDVHADLRLRSRMPAVCSALDTSMFRMQNGVSVIRRVGPPQSSTTTWFFSLRG